MQKRLDLKLYCWDFTTVDGRNPAPVNMANDRVSYMSDGAGFLPSTVAFYSSSVRTKVQNTRVCEFLVPTHR